MQRLVHRNHRNHYVSINEMSVWQGEEAGLAKRPLPCWHSHSCPLVATASTPPLYCGLLSVLFAQGALYAGQAYQANQV